MKTPKQNKKSGAILVIVMVILVTFTLFVSALLQMGNYNAQETEQQVRETQAFWCAEEGVQQARLDLVEGGNGLVDGNAPNFKAGTGRAGTYQVISDGTAKVSIGTITVGGVTITNRIRFETDAIDSTYDTVISGLNKDGSEWSFILSGSGDDADGVYGDIYVGENGNIYVLDEAGIYVAISPNTYEFSGDANTHNGQIHVDLTASIAGEQNTSAPIRTGPNLPDMDYPNNNTHDLAAIFDAAGVESGHLPIGHPLRDVVVKNPSDRSDENNSTPGDDYYFEPTTGWSNAGGSQGAATPLDIGDDRVYYVDGHVWVHSYRVYGFEVDGTATIVASKDIHISDNIKYENNSSEAGGDLLALIALGEYDEADELIPNTGGDIYFGDPEFGTLATMDAFMFAANDFYYNFSANSGDPGEPESGFEVFGNFVALNEIKVYRDWYGTSSDPNPALYDPETSTWSDAITGTELTGEQVNGYTETWYYSWDRRHRWPQTRVVPGLRHYKMIVKYDERIHDPDTQPPDLPRAGSGEGGSSGDLTKWQHADADDS